MLGNHLINDYVIYTLLLTVKHIAHTLIVGKMIGSNLSPQHHVMIKDVKGLLVYQVCDNNGQKSKCWLSAKRLTQVHALALRESIYKRLIQAGMSVD